MEVLRKSGEMNGKRKVAQNGSKTGKCFTKCFTTFHQKAEMVKQW